MIIGLGIAALIGILTLLDGINSSVTKSFSAIGAKVFTIQANGQIDGRGRGRTNKKNPEFTYTEIAEAEQQLEEVSVKLSIEAPGGNNRTASYQNIESDPNVRISGINQFYAEANALEFTAGRFMTRQEILDATNVCIIGADLSEKLFSTPEQAINKFISTNDATLRVVGVVKNQGSIFGQNEAYIKIPLGLARRLYQVEQFQLQGIVSDPSEMENSIASATGVFRNVRKLRTLDDNNFVIETSEAQLEDFNELYGNVVLMGSVIGGITLLGASVALMNILLVSVNERTREIGVSKALGAKSGTIRYQFLWEAIILCQFGGITGIIAGVAIGNGIAFFMELDFILPIKWIILGISVCFVVGIGSGWYPAYRASKLDPIEALRFE